MLERARELGPFKQAAILIAALVLAGGVVWLLADRGGSEPAAELARSSSPGPAPVAPAAPSTDSDGSDDRADRDADRKRERRDRDRDDRARADEPTDRGRDKASGPAAAEERDPGRKDVNEVVENLFGGKPDRSPSQAELPPELSALLQGSDGPEPSKPSPTLEELLEAASSGG